MTITKDKEAPDTQLDLGVYLGATGSPFEVRVQRKSYGDPVTATRVNGNRAEPLPAGPVKNFSGFSKFLHITLTDAKGKKVLDRVQDACPASEAARVKPGAPDKSPYPVGCSNNPWTLGSVWGIQNGWATNLTGYDRPDAPVSWRPASTRPPSA